MCETKPRSGQAARLVAPLASGPTTERLRQNGASAFKPAGREHAVTAQYGFFIVETDNHLAPRISLPCELGNAAGCAAGQSSDQNGRAITEFDTVECRWPAARDRLSTGFIEAKKHPSGPVHLVVLQR